MTVALISVRAASTRFPNKCFLRLSTGKSILEHVIGRCKFFELEPIVATSTNDIVILENCSSMNVKCFAGSENDKLIRWRDACSKYNVKSFVSVDCDDPLFDGTLSHAQHQLLEKYDVVSPDMDAYLGSNGWAFKVSALELMCAKKTSTMTEMVSKFVLDELSVAKFDAIPLPFEKDLRLTLDYVEDFRVISKVIKSLGQNCSRQRTIEYFQLNEPKLRFVNEFRNTDWKRKQEQS